tara:strand:+ start:399 stop:1109 length:711 start_codon:yes stop_codon:yes gene_type:complete
MVSWVSLDIGDSELSSSFRESASQYYSESLDVPPKLTAALLSTQELSHKQYLQSLRKIHKGAGVRHRKKAIKAGFFCAPFQYGVWLNDIHDINTSKETRQGRQMTSSYQRQAHELGQQGNTIVASSITKDECYRQMFGVFKHEPNRHQTDVMVNQRLCGYISLIRYKDLALYSQILGHGDYLRTGIMYLLHCYVSGRVWGKVKYIMYAAHTSGTDGLKMWKKRMRFEPYYLHVKDK